MNLEVLRSYLARTRVTEDPITPLAEGDARIEVSGFALTSNNISYAVFGDALKYWNFFPAETDADGAWGRIPVWGFGVVTESLAEGIAVGERIYGYFPMGSELVITPGSINAESFADLSPHRAEMASAYSRYTRTSADIIYRADRESEHMLLYPLFFTSFVVDDYLEDQADFGASTTIVSSASSKTAIGIAFLSKARGHRVIGLTSLGNRRFVESLRIYDAVVPYEEIPSMEIEPSVFVDIAGDPDVVRSVHTHLGESLTFSVALGGTHWNHAAQASTEPLPGPKPKFFFAPDQIAKRNADWGRSGLGERALAAWDPYVGWCGDWLEFREVTGADDVRDTYLALLDGRTDPRVGYICSLTK
jgi:hypothetical protein